MCFATTAATGGQGNNDGEFLRCIKMVYSALAFCKRTLLSWGLPFRSTFVPLSGANGHKDSFAILFHHCFTIIQRQYRSSVCPALEQREVYYRCRLPNEICAKIGKVWKTRSAYATIFYLDQVGIFGSHPRSAQKFLSSKLNFAPYSTR